MVADQEQAEPTGDAGKSKVAQSGQDRMTADQRRDELMDIGLDLLRRGGIEAVSIGSVADRAGVTRTLVYKHFANRDGIVGEVYRREATKLHEEIRSRVVQQEGFEARLRAFIDAVLWAVDSYGWMFGAREPQPHEASYLNEQKLRDRRTIRAFAQMASDEYGISLRDATSAMGILLSGIASLRLQAHVLTEPEDREFLANLYMDLVLGGLRGLSEREGLAPGVPDGEQADGSL